MAQVTKKTLIGEALSIDEEIAPILMGIGMHCHIFSKNLFSFPVL